MPKNTIHKSPSGRYSYSVTDSVGNRLSIKSRVRESKADFRKRCDALDATAEGEQRKETLDVLFTAWIQMHVTPNLSKGSLRTLPNVYQKYVSPYLGRRQITDIKRQDVFQVLSKAKESGLSPATIKRVRHCISAPYSFAINSLGYQISSPTEGLRFNYGAKQKKTRRVLTEEERERLLTAAEGSKYENYIKILDMTGMRPSEALALKCSDITESAIHIRRGITIDGLSSLKTETSRRDFPLYPALRSVVQQQKTMSAFRTKEGWLFPSASGTPSMNAAKIAFAKIVKKTGVWRRGGHNHLKKLELLTPPLHCTLYDFRHTFATRSAESGMNPTVLKNILGHADISTTLRYYVDTTDKMMEQAVELMEKSV